MSHHAEGTCFRFEGLWTAGDRHAIEDAVRSTEEAGRAGVHPPRPRHWHCVCTRVGERTYFFARSQGSASVLWAPSAAGLAAKLLKNAGLRDAGRGLG